MTRVLHTGDTHIGYRQYHSPERRADFLDAFDRVVRDAIESEVDAVVHAGDLFHDRRPALADIHGTIEILRDLRDVGIPLYAVVGNHERTRGQQWLDLFQTLGLATRLGRRPELIDDVALYGLDFVPRSRRDNLDYEFEPHDVSHAALVTHGLFEPFAHADWDTRSIIEESNVDFDVLLLGDNHQPGVETVGDTWVTYCGSTERVDATERADRGYNLVTFEDDVTIARRGIETRPFVTVELELAPGEGTERVRERLREEELGEAVVVVALTGDGEPVSPAEIETFATDRGALVARVTDRREFEAADIESVRFADPDQAVQERLRTLGLSDAALAIDEVVRDQDVPKTTVRGEVREHIESLLADDPNAFEPAEAGPSPETIAESHEEAAQGDRQETGSRADETVSAKPDDTDPEAPGDGGETDGAKANEEREVASPVPEAGEESEDQVTMEDFL